MATVAHGRTSSNNQRGTVGLSAGDYIRLKRLQAFSSARNYAATIADNTDVDVPTFPQTAYAVPFLKPKHTGASRIRRTNEQWINYRASQTADVMRFVNIDSCQAPRVPIPVRLCNCDDNYIEPGPKISGGKCCVGKIVGATPIYLNDDITACQSEKAYTLYTFTVPTSSSYDIRAYEIDGSDPDLFISYPNGHMNPAEILSDQGGPTVLYRNTNGGDSFINGISLVAGQVYEIAVFQYSGTCYRITIGYD